MSKESSVPTLSQPAGSVFDDDEDNNPFSTTQGLASLMNEHRISSSHLHRNGTSDQTGVKQANGKHNESLKSPDGTGSDDDASILLYHSSSNNQGEIDASNKDTFNAIHINYESRVTKLLKPTSNPMIQITEAGNSNEGLSNSSKKYIVYTIKLINGDDLKDEIQTRRRYSEFESLRDVLTKVFPLIIIPPIPPKNFLNLSLLNGLVSNNLSQSGAGGAGGTAGGVGTGNAAGSVSSGVASSASGNANGAAESSTSSNYSYINSKHLNQHKLIEHRKRLLSNFLNNCLEIPQIRNLEFFAKFLDPNANWSDEISLITSQLPKSIYLSNPENGLKTDQLYANLPIPVSSHPSLNISFFKDNKKRISKRTSKLLGSDKPALASDGDEQSPPSSNPSAKSSNTTASDNALSTKTSPVNQAGDHNLETSQTSIDNNYIIGTSRLDEINKKMMDNFIGLANDYTELGTAFNSFSVVLSDSPITRSSKVKSNNSSDESDDTKLNLVFEKIGQVFDRSYITINSLIGDLETKFSEPLGEAVQYSNILQYINKYSARKCRQQRLLDSELREKRKDLSDLLKLEEESAKIDGATVSHAITPDAKYDFSDVQQQSSQQEGDDRQQQQPKNRFKFFPSRNQFKKITQYVTDIIDQNPEQTRKQKIATLQEKIKVLESCQKIMLEDVSYITDEVDKNFKKFHAKELKIIYQILLTYNGFLIGWARKNIDIWEEIKEEIEKV